MVQCKKQYGASRSPNLDFYSQKTFLQGGNLADPLINKNISWRFTIRLKYPLFCPTAEKSTLLQQESGQCRYKVNKHTRCMILRFSFHFDLKTYVKSSIPLVIGEMVLAIYKWIKRVFQKSCVQGLHRTILQPWTNCNLLPSFVVFVLLLNLWHFNSLLSFIMYYVLNMWMNEWMNEWMNYNIIVEK